LVKGSDFEIQGLGLRGYDLGFRVWGLGYRNKCLGFGV
jgi:hypothetical protein